MPRETVYPEHHGDSDHPFPAISVQWTKERYLQVGLVLDDESPTLASALFEDNVEAIGSRLVGLLQSRGRSITDEDSDAENPAHQFIFDDEVLGGLVLEALDDVYPVRSWWTTLDRFGANRLVRVVRAARSSVFGKDE